MSADSDHGTKSWSGSDKAEAALAARLRAVAPFLLSGSQVASDPDPAVDVANTLEAIVESAVGNPTNDRLWLLLTALCAAYPTRGEVDRTRRLFELHDQREAVISLLDSSLSIASARGEAEAEIDIIVGGVIVDVDHSAKHDLHTGIQRVTRSLLPIWDGQHDVTPAAWTRPTGALRRLSSTEIERVIAWAKRTPTASDLDAHDDQLAVPRLVVPWRSVVVMAEVPPGNASDSLAGIGDYSGNRLVGIAYDAIPVVSADMVPAPDTSKFVRYLTCLKFAHRMAGISGSAVAEIAGFVQALHTQGVPARWWSRSLSFPRRRTTLNENDQQAAGRAFSWSVVMSLGRIILRFSIPAKSCGARAWIFRCHSSGAAAGATTFRTEWPSWRGHIGR